MGTKVILNGTVVEPEEAKVSIFDRGFLYGDSIYEVMRTYGGRPFAMTEHLARLERSAAGIGMELPVSREALAAEVALGLAQSRNAESYVRVVVTRGAGEIGLDPSLAHDPLRVVIVRPLQTPEAALYEGGARVALVGPARQSFDLGARGNPKTGNYLANVLALRRAKQRGAYEALLVDAHGRVIEGSSSNVFIVEHGALRTPPLSNGILEGITRSHVLDLARELGLHPGEEDIDEGRLRATDEAFITSTIREIVPIAFVDDHPIGTGRVGPITRLLMERFRAKARGH